MQAFGSSISASFLLAAISDHEIACKNPCAANWVSSNAQVPLSISLLSSCSPSQFLSATELLSAYLMSQSSVSLSESQAFSDWLVSHFTCDHHPCPCFLFSSAQTLTAFASTAYSNRSKSEPVWPLFVRGKSAWRALYRLWAACWVSATCDRDSYQHPSSSFRCLIQAADMHFQSQIACHSSLLFSKCSGQFCYQKPLWFWPDLPSDPTQSWFSHLQTTGESVYALSHLRVQRLFWQTPLTVEVWVLCLCWVGGFLGQYFLQRQRSVLAS